MGENAGQRPAVRVVVIKGFLSRSRDGGAAVVGRDRPGWGETRALDIGRAMRPRRRIVGSDEAARMARRLRARRSRAEV